MNGGGGDAPPPSLPVNGGEFLLQLLRKPPNPHPSTPSTPQSTQTFSLDPAVAAMGPTVPTFVSPQSNFPSNSHDFPYRPWGNSPSPLFAPHNFFTQNPNTNPILNPDVSSPPGGFGHAPHQYGVQFNHVSPGENFRTLGYLKDNPKASPAHQQEQNIIFGSLNRDIRRNEAAVEGSVLLESLDQRGKLLNQYSEEGLGMDGRLNGFRNAGDINGNSRGNSCEWRGFEQERSRGGNNRGSQSHDGNYRALAPTPTPPGFSSKIKNVGNRERGSRRAFDHNADKGKVNYSEFNKNYSLSNHLDTPEFQAGRNILAVSISDNEESLLELHGGDGDNGEELGHGGQNKMSRDPRRSELNDLEDQLVASLGLGDESDEKSDKKKNHRDKDYRSDKRGQWILGQRMRNLKRQTACRSDLYRFDAPFLAVYDSLIPADEEKVKQKQLLTALEKLVINEWPEARLFLYGSCANSFGFSKSDLDVCLALKEENVDKCEILLKLAEILESNNFQNVQALTRARVPIVKLMDPDTGISCDICVNNVLAVVNTKLLRDYALIDVRLRQLAFIVKHWAKSRGVNETYQGTLSSYAYVLMCINFLQQRRPAILPCLQGMNITYYATVDNVECAYFDKVEKLANFGSRNGESIARLVWAFFYYWAYCHDYANDVISVRLGITLSKRAKDWTRRVGNDRHLICIEDPFEVSHDLGRVVDKYSIRVLREEFERAAEIMQYDSNPCATLFEPYVPN